MKSFRWRILLTLATLAGSSHLLDAAFRLGRFEDSGTLGLTAVRAVAVAVAIFAAWAPFHLALPELWGEGTAPLAGWLAVVWPWIGWTAFVRLSSDGRWADPFRRQLLALPTPPPRGEQDVVRASAENPVNPEEIRRELAECDRLLAHRRTYMEDRHPDIQELMLTIQRLEASLLNLDPLGPKRPDATPEEQVAPTAAALLRTTSSSSDRCEPTRTKLSERRTSMPPVAASTATDEASPGSSRAKPSAALTAADSSDGLKVLGCVSVTNASTRRQTLGDAPTSGANASSRFSRPSPRFHESSARAVWCASRSRSSSSRFWRMVAATAGTLATASSCCSSSSSSRILFGSAGSTASQSEW